MKKKLIGRDQLASCLDPDGKTITLDGTMILTPGARDQARNLGVNIVYKKRNEPVGCVRAAADVQPVKPTGQGDETVALVNRVVALLRGEFAISDAKTIEAVTVEVLRRVQSGAKP